MCVGSNLKHENLVASFSSQVDKIKGYPLGYPFILLCRSGLEGER